MHIKDTLFPISSASKQRTRLLAEFGVFLYGDAILHEPARQQFSQLSTSRSSFGAILR